MRDFVWTAILLALVAALVGVFYLKVSLDVLATIAMGALCLGWLFILVTLPWNLHFEAKRLLFEMQRSRERGIAVNADREAYAIWVRNRMFWVSIGAHVVSAAIMAVVTWLRGGEVGYYFAGFYLLSSLFRPGFELYGFLRQRLGELMQEVKYPREDVLKLRGDVHELKSRTERHEDQLEEIRKEIGKLGSRLESKLGETREEMRGRHAGLERRLEAVSRKFEETVDQMTDNQEIITGVKAFLRLLATENRAAS
ncbi:MAG: hypothetical protein HYY25_07320 [Candidatus Wallbacteria bacterium]|nr:hypothetical protein [Candidatus Wallbacteria bacterium]